MAYHPFDEKTLGLYVEDSILKVAAVLFEKKQVQVSELFDIPLTPQDQEGDVKQLYSEPAPKKLNQFTNSYLSISGIAASDLLVRRLRIKLTKDKDIDEAFPFQAEPLLPYPLESAVLDKMITEKQEGMTLLTFFSVKKDAVKKHLIFWQNLGIDPEVVSAEPLALSAFAASFFAPSPALFVVHIGKFSTLCILLKEGKLLSSHTIACGWDMLYQAFSQDAQNPVSVAELFSSDLLTTDLSDKPRFKKAFDELFHSIQWNYLAQIKETKLKETPHIATLGEGANIQNLDHLLAKSLEIPLTLIQDNQSSFSLNEIRSYALPIGLALTGQPHLRSPVNFRKQEFIYSTPWKRFQKSLFLFAGLALLLAIALYFFGLNYLNFKEDELKKRYLALLSLVQKPYEQFEKQVESKYPSGHDLLPISALNSDTLNLRLDLLEKEIRAMPDTFPLWPHIPKVSDVLAWLSTHPTLTCKEDQQDQGGCPSFSIDTFHYAVVKRPELNKKNEKYQVKIDLEFTTSSPRLAREFHDALITPNDFVDPKGEIKWSATKGKYITSFFLKDKTIYPSPIKEK